MMKILSSHIVWAKTYIHAQILTMMLAETLFRWVYTCKDCFFFKNGVCHHPTVNMFTSEEDPSCEHFEYKEIKVEL